LPMMCTVDRSGPGNRAVAALRVPTPSARQHRPDAALRDHGCRGVSGDRGIEQSLDLCPVEVVDQRLVGLLGRDRSDAKGLIEAGRNRYSM
jgi:hypothetical protein